MEDLLPLIGQFYDAALDPELWQPVLAGLGAYFDTVQTFVVMENAVDPAASVFHGSVYDAAWIGRYVETYMLINPMRLACVGRTKAGDALLTTDYMTAAEYGATRFSRELLAEKGVVDIAVAMLEQTATRTTLLSAHRSVQQGFADETLRRKLQLVMPHAQRAVRIAGLLEHRAMAAASLADTLDMLAAAVFLMTEPGGVVHANARAVDLMAEGDLVRDMGGRLVLLDRAASTALSNALERAAQGDATLGAVGRSIACESRTGRKFIATVMPLMDGRRRSIGTPYRAVAALCLKEAEFEAASDTSALAALYNLTQRETTILVASVEVGGTLEVSAALGISEATVKSHLKAIFRKTGASRQADLVKLVAGINGPFGS